MRTIPDVTPADLDELVGKWPCVGETHYAGLGGHVPPEPAKYLIVCPNCGWSSALCKGRVEHMRMVGLVACGKCKEENRFLRWRLVPL